MSEQSQRLQSALSQINIVANDNDKEKLRFLASAVVPYGDVEEVKAVPKIYQCLRKQESTSKHAVELLKRMLHKAGFKFEHVSLLNEHIAKPKADFRAFPDMLFHELLISVADELGNGKYLTELLYDIPDEKFRGARDTIKSAVQLFQSLLHQRTISADNRSDLAIWLEDIGRNDIATKVRETTVQEQGSPYFNEYIILKKF